MKFTGKLLIILYLTLLGSPLISLILAGEIESLTVPLVYSAIGLFIVAVIVTIWLLYPTKTKSRQGTLPKSSSTKGEKSP